MSGLLTQEKMLEFKKQVEAAGGTSDYDKSAGTIICKDPHGLETFRGIQKYKAGPWICRFINTETMKWHHAPQL